MVSALDDLESVVKGIELGAEDYLPKPFDSTKKTRYFDKLPDLKPGGQVLSSELSYLLGRYGDETGQVLACANAGENQPIANLPNLWSEIRWAARTGAVEHLDDLLLRRVRLGMQLANGGSGVIERVREIAQAELGWSDAKWETELARYYAIYAAAYSPAPEGF